LLEIGVRCLSQGRVGGRAKQRLDVVVIGDQRGERFVTAQVATQSRNGKTQRRTGLEGGLVHIGARGNGTALEGGKPDENRQNDKDQRMSQFHEDNGLLLRSSRPKRPRGASLESRTAVS